jgi:hypothetical protein
MLQPNILLLKEGTESNQGKAQIISNINSCMGLVELVRSTLVIFSLKLGPQRHGQDDHR